MQAKDDKPAEPKYIRLRNALADQIRKGKYPLGSCIPPESEWMKAFGVSRHTVRQAQDILEHEGVLSREQGRGTFVRQMPREHIGNDVARISEICVLTPCVTISLYPWVIRGVQDICAEHSVHVLAANYDVIPEKMRRLAAEMADGLVAGLVVCPSYNTTYSDLRLLAERKIPFVLVDSGVDGIEADLVCTDNFQGAFDGTKALVKAGCKRIAFLSGHLSASTSRERLAGFREAISSSRLEPGAIKEGAFTTDFGFSATKELLAADPNLDGFFVANDPIAVGVVRAAREMGRRIPEDLVICSFDEPELTYSETAPLIVANQPRHEIGKAAASSLLERIAAKAEGKPESAPRIIRIAASIAIADAVKARIAAR